MNQATREGPHANQTRGSVLLAGGIGLGAGLIYLLDPERGRRRRKLMVDKVIRAAHVTAEALDATGRDLRNRAQGVAQITRSGLRPQPVDDVVLVERVRSRIGRVVSHPGAIWVTAEQGRVTLSGPVLAREVDDLITTVERVRGVRGVKNRLQVYRQAGDIPGLQGGATPPGIRPDILQEYWSPTTRLLAGTVGGALAWWSVRRRGPLGLAAGGAGLSLLARALTNLSFQRLFGIGAGRRAVTFHKDITVAAPVAEVFRFWSNFENFPRFMEHVRQIRLSADGRSHWTVAGPAGVPVRFDAVITQLVPNQVLAWKTVDGSIVQHSGVIRFQHEGAGMTRLDIRMSYNPIAGAFGHLVAALFGSDPKRAMDEDLVRFKSLIEQGKTTAHGEEVRREQVTQAQI